MAASPQQLKALNYKIYVDGQAAQFDDTRCASTPTALGYACSGRLPSLSPGRHTIELRSVLNGQESPPSLDLLIDILPSSQTSKDSRH
jgi:hypothetical protein